jgi:hypothetical protein
MHAIACPGTTPCERTRQAGASFGRYILAASKAWGRHSRNNGTPAVKSTAIKSALVKSPAISSFRGPTAVVRCSGPYASALIRVLKALAVGFATMAVESPPICPAVVPVRPVNSAVGSPATPPGALTPPSIPVLPGGFAPSGGPLAPACF